MKTIGLLGGMSWESTERYYRFIQEETKRRLGPMHSAPVVLMSVEFQKVHAMQHAGDWDAAGAYLADHARRAQAAGADLLILCTNTMHKVAPAIEAAIDIPFLHIADATASAIRAQGLDTVGLLGTHFTMEQDFYRERLALHGVTALVPDAEDRELVNRVIYQELVDGTLRPDSRDAFLRIMQTLASRGAQGMIEGCTEIGMLVTPEHTDIPLFETGWLHCEAAVDAASGKPRSWEPVD